MTIWTALKKMKIQEPIYGVRTMILKDLPFDYVEISLIKTDGTIWRNSQPIHRGDNSNITLRSMAWHLELQLRGKRKLPGWQKIAG